MWVERLASAVNWEPLNTNLPWRTVEEGLGTQLPEDCKRIAETFGAWDFSEFLQVISVDDARHLDLARTWQKHLDQSPRVRPPVFAPYEIYRPGRRGLIPWGCGELKCGYFWLASAEHDPATWPLVTRGPRYPWHHVEMCTAEFICRVLTGSDVEPFSIARQFPEPDFSPIEPVL
ncbi:hypothetical protein GCM10010277_68740 [Streptomyces longisporoflavus]|uniref:hypothetical protein n=1 Tax=Streptomyces longisporoflavus TaxID=28044 RepID=UPI00167F0E36|nr:hypothetical protein [Streptomyces longisporoflavus]GGV62982.1 hypothetical protein GCM10010277_68740 [Streptomyces longisporoflavus]